MSVHNTATMATAPAITATAPSEPNQTPDPVQSQAPDTSVPSPDPVVTPEVEAQPTFAPSLKFKVMEEEKELPEYLKDVITDEQREKELKDIWTKAHGLDHAKPKHVALQEEHTKLQQTHQGLQNELQTLMGEIQEARQCYQEGDLDAFFEKFSVEEEKVLQWAYNKAQLSQLPPEQRQAHDQRQAALRDAREAKKQNFQIGSEASKQLSAATEEMISIVFERPDVKTYREAFDALPGRKPGSFEKMIRKTGNSFWKEGKYLPPSQVVKEFMEEWPLGALAPAATGAPPASGAAAPKDPLPTIPNVSGKTAVSPVKSKINSIKDLENYRKEKFGS
jgi:hypothetical protein